MVFFGVGGIRRLNLLVPSILVRGIFYTQPATGANAMASPRDETASFPRITDAWWSTVLPDTNSFSPISALDMFDVLAADTKSLYVDDKAFEMLEEALLNYAQMGFSNASLVNLGEATSIIAIRVGTMKTTSLALALRSYGYSVEQYDGFLKVETGEETPPLIEILNRIGEGENVDLFAGAGNLLTEKFHPYLTRESLELDAISSKLGLRTA